MTNKRILTLITLLLFLFLLAGCWPWTINQPPEITSAPVKTATVGVPYTYDVEATDPDAEDVLTYTLISVEPSGMEINPVSGEITWTPIIDDVGDVDVTVEVSDGKLSDTQGFTITVTVALNNDATLSDLTVDVGTLDPEFDSGTFTYTVELPADNKILPTVTATTTDSNATKVITQVDWTHWIATVVVTAEDGVAKETYTINFTEAPLAVGDSYGGGIVAYIFQDNGDDPADPGYIAGETHGLIAATYDQSTGIAWITGGDTQSTYVNGIDATGTSTYLGTGATNTAAIIAQAVAAGNVDLSTYAAGVCDDYSVTVDGITYDDWYLPSKDELGKLYDNRETIGGFTDDKYWSSSELLDIDTKAWGQTFGTGDEKSYFKGSNPRVRAVRAF